MKINRITDILQEKFGISQQVIGEAEESATKQGESLSLTQILIKKKIVTEEIILKALAYQYDIPLLEHLDIEPDNSEFTNIIPIHFLKTYTIVPLILEKDDRSTNPDKTIIAINNPDNLQAVDDLVSILQIIKYKLVLSSKEEILSTINNFYEKKTDSAQQIVDDMEDDESIINEISQTSDLLDDTSDAPIIKLVNHIISQSVKANASDIHIVPGADSLKVRYRIDGILYELLEPPKWIQSSLITRIKVMAGMDIAEKGYF